MRIAGRLAVLALMLLFVGGHVAVCAVMGLVGRQAAEAQAASCPLHQTAPADTSVGPGSGTPSVSCCAPLEGRSGTPAAQAASSFTVIDPAHHRAGVLLPPIARTYAPRARDSADPASVPARLLFAVFLI